MSSNLGNVFFPLFWGYKRKWNRSSVTPAVSANQNWPQLSAGYKFQAHDPQFAQFRLNLGEARQWSCWEVWLPKNKTNLLWQTWFRLKLHWQKQYNPSVIVPGLVCRHEAWDISFQLGFLFIVWQRFFCDWWNPCVSLQVSRCHNTVKWLWGLVAGFIHSFIYLLTWLYTNSSTLSFKRGTMLHREYFGCLLQLHCCDWPELPPPREHPPLFCSLMSLTSVVSTSASTTAFGTSELKILNTDSSGSSPLSCTRWVALMLHRPRFSRFSSVVYLILAWY